ncbi:MAG: hypothetical protein HC942_29845 [Microcoleus sp. SU_5_6]|nr:hypothetical protein [Microcoleus sp. SU_5_6]
MNFLPRETLIVVCTAGAIATTVAPMTTPTPPELSKPLEQATVVFGDRWNGNNLSRKKMTSEVFVWRVWRLTTGQAQIQKCVIQKKTPSFVWAIPPALRNTKVSNSDKFDANGLGKYSQEPCVERLFFFESQAIAYAEELGKNPKPYN